MKKSIKTIIALTLAVLSAGVAFAKPNAINSSPNNPIICARAFVTLTRSIVIIIVLRPVLRYQSPVDDSGSSFLKIASSSFFASVFVMAYRYSGSTLTSKSQFCDKYPATVVAAKWSS